MISSKLFALTLLHRVVIILESSVLLKLQFLSPVNLGMIETSLLREDFVIHKNKKELKNNV